MPYSAPRPCTHPGCPELTNGGPCELHKRQAMSQYNGRRGSAASMGYDRRWRNARKRYLSENPLCLECRKAGVVTAAEVVDHRIPHKGDMRLFWDRTNWQPLCRRHHDEKTAREDGRWGTRRSKPIISPITGPGGT
jgi:5-methylcytosine-specific restriction enzyme A